MSIYPVLCSVCGYSIRLKSWAMAMAMVMGYGWGLGLLGPGSPGYKDKPMWCLGHPIHFITFHSMSNLYKIIDIGCTGWPSRLNQMAVGDLLGF